MVVSKKERHINLKVRDLIEKVPLNLLLLHLMLKREVLFISKEVETQMLMVSSLEIR